MRSHKRVRALKCLVAFHEPDLCPPAGHGVCDTRFRRERRIRPSALASSTKATASVPLVELRRSGARSHWVGTLALEVV